MSILLANIVLWPFLILISLPPIIHLFARSRPPAYNFSSVEFILRVLRSTMRIKKPQDWLVLLLRTVLFTAVILMFLQPLFFSQRRMASLAQRKNAVIIVDATASMAFADGAQTRFAAACAEASGILSGMSGRDLANIIWLDSSPSPVFPEMGSNLSYLQSELRRAVVTSEAANIQAAVRTAVELLAETDGRREIYVISDFQTTAWSGVDLPVPANVDLIKIPVAHDLGSNGAVADLLCEPPSPLVGEDVTIVCEVRNYSPQPRGRTLYLTAGDKRQSVSLLIPAWGKAAGTMRHRFFQDGPVAITARLDEDSFVGDDERWHVVDVRQSLRIGLVEGNDGTGAIWRRATDAMGWAQTDVLPMNALTPDLPHDALMLASWDGSHSDAILACLSRGCTVVFSPAGGADISGLSGTDHSGSQKTTEMRWEQRKEPIGVRVADRSDRVFRIFADGDCGDPSRGHFYGRLVPATNLVPLKIEMLMTYDDGVPALARLGSSGQLYMWNMPLAREFSDWAGQMEFLPFLAELLLTSRQERQGTSREHVCGENIGWRFDHDIQAADVSLHGSADEHTPVTAHDDGGRKMVISEIPPSPGLYTWTYRGQPVGYSVVNFPSIESDLRTMPPDTIVDAKSLVVDNAARVRALRDGVHLWPRLFFVCSVVALAEGAVLLWAGRT